MKSVKKVISHEKENGRVYTPFHIVENILNMSGYTGKDILKKHVMENSCGDGAFLREIVKRYCEVSILDNCSLSELKNDLETYIHGIEIDQFEHQKCINNMDNVAKDYGIENVKWDIICGDTLCIHDYDGKMDFVLGNPPYVRVHNLGDSFDAIKNYSFAREGMTDMFIVFYEIGIRMLSEKGVLGYITPSSFFNSLAGTHMRRVFVENNYIDKIIDLKHYQAFSATTYTTIVVLRRNKANNEIGYYEYDSERLVPYYVDTLSSDDYFIDGNYFFSSKNNLEIIKNVFYNRGECQIYVKNGYATLCDTVFINDFDFESKYIIPVIKASKGIQKKIFFPYDSSGKLIGEEEISDDLQMYSYLLERKEKLKQRSHEKEDDKYWYSFGRSQAINDTFRDKLSVNSLLRNVSDLKLVEAPAGTGVYSGLYIISDTVPFDEIIKVLKTDEFISYISLLGKYKSGGYYTFSSKDLKAFFDYKFNYCEEF